MKRFDYVRPTTIPEAVAAASAPGAAYLAAGTNLLDLMKGGVSRPDRLVDVTHLPGLDRIEPLADGALRIGASPDRATAGRGWWRFEVRMSARSARVRHQVPSAGTAPLFATLRTRYKARREDDEPSPHTISHWLSCR